MRARYFAFILLTVLATGTFTASAPSLALAQGDFDDEFGPLPPPPPPPAPAPAPAPAPTPAEPPPAAPEPPPAPPAPPATAPTAPAPAPAAPGDGFDDEFGPVPSAPSGSSAPTVPTPPTTPSTSDTMSTTTAGSMESAEPGVTRTTRVTPDTPDSDEERLRARRFRVHNTYLGPTGGLHVVDAASGPRGTFRVSLMGEFFRAKGFLEGGAATRFGGALALSWTAHENIEVFGSFQSYATTSADSDPNLVQVLGDTHLGLKGFAWLNDVLALGGDVDLNLLNRVGDIGVVLRSTSLGLRANLTADLRGLDNPIPFVIRFNARYWMDNSSELIEDTEDQRYLGIEDPLPRIDERRHLVTAGERFALEVNRTDFFDISLGLEAPLRAAEDIYISPLLEWNWRIPINRRGYDCVFIPDPDRPGSPEEGDDGCLDRQGVSSFPMNLTLGVRLLPKVRGLSLTVAADVGLTGVRTLVRELAPTQKYNIYFGASYAYDTRPMVERHEVEVERTVEVGPPPRGRVAGLVVEQGTETPIPNAIVRFPGQSPLLTGPDGRFVSYLFDPGDVSATLEHEEYEPGSCSATVPAAEPGATTDVQVEARCEMVALPRRGAVDGQVIDEDGPVSGVTLALTGPGGEERTLTSDGSGRFQADELPPGTYQVRVDSERHLIKLAEITVVARETINPEITLFKRPRRSLVRVTRRAIIIRRQINFATNSDEILERSFPLMEEIADVLIRNPQITRVEIQGHTDNRGGRDHNQELSQRRADAVRAWLITHGVAPERLEAIGYGQTRPLVPNITSSNRARNRRVQFMVVEQSDQ